MTNPPPHTRKTRLTQAALAALLCLCPLPVTAADTPSPTAGSASTSTTPAPRTSRLPFLRLLRPRTPNPAPPTATEPAPIESAAALIPPPPPLSPNQQTVLRAQLDLANRGFSPGSIDGVSGPKTQAAIRAFQTHTGLPPSGQLDQPTLTALYRPHPTYSHYVVTQADLDRLHPVGSSWLSKSAQPRLDYETLPELVAEQAHCSPTLIHKLNPNINWTHVLPGTTLSVPNSSSPLAESKAAFLRICLEQRTLQAFDSHTNLIAHFPCSIGRNVGQRPVGYLEISVLIPNPNYTFNPAVFPESEEGRRLGRKLVIPPGPNNPVGTTWIGLSRPGYGIHGTPKPETVGRAESHGCFRLTNWNAQYLLSLSWVSMPVYIDEHCPLQ